MKTPSSVRVAQLLVVPDLRLRAPDDRGPVLLEIVAYWEPAYLAKKVEAAADVEAPIVVCLDAQSATRPLSPAPSVASDRAGRVDVIALIAAADGALESVRAPGAPPPRAGRFNVFSAAS